MRRTILTDFYRISIHALREEGDSFGNYEGVDFWQFLSTPSARRATPSGGMWFPATTHFYPRPPRGGRPTTGVPMC